MCFLHIMKTISEGKCPVFHAVLAFITVVCVKNLEEWR